MRKLAKTGLLAIVLIVGVSLLAGTVVNAQVRIVHWEHFSEGLAQMAETLARQFEAENPGIVIDYDPMPYANFWERILISLETGTGPDVFKVPYGNAREFYLQGLIAPIPESIMTNEEIESAFAPWTIEDFYFDGQYYAAPVDIQMMLLFVNKSLFEEAGLEVRQPKDWDEIVEWSKALTKRDSAGRLTQVGLDISASRAVYKTLMMQYLDPVTVVNPETMTVNYDSPDGIAAWQFIHDLIFKHEVSDPNFMGGQAVFAQGRAGMMINGTWTMADLQLNYPELEYATFVIPPPAHKPDSALSRAVKYGWFVSSRSSNPEAAWEWIMYASSAEAQNLWREMEVSLPSRLSVIHDERWLEDDPHWPAILATVDTASSKDTIIGWADINSVRGQLWQTIVHNQMPVADAVRRFAARENEVLREKKELFDWIEANK